MAKKKNDADIYLKPALIRSTKYYFRNSLLILLLNFLYLTSFYTAFKSSLLVHLAGYATEKHVELISFGISLGLLYTFKILLFSITIDNMFKDIANGFSLVLEQVCTRFFPVLATTLLVVILTVFLSVASALIFAIPGIICFVYCMFAPSISAIRSKDDGTLSGKKVIMGTSAIAKSFSIVKGNFFRISLYNILVAVILIVIVQIPVLDNYANANGVDVIKFIIFDFAIIFNITAMIVMEKKQQDKDDEKSNRYDKKYHFKR